MGRRVSLVRAILALVLLAALAVVSGRWPRTAFSVIYLTVCAFLIVRYARHTSAAPGAAETTSSVLVDLAHAHLSAAPGLTRLRRYLSGGLLIIAHAVLWPMNVVSALVGRSFLRRDASGRLVPALGRPLLLFYGDYMVRAALFAMLPLAILVLSARDRAREPFAVGLFAVLAASLCSRHLAMLIFPHDLKATLRRTLGDPRIFFVIHLCVDTFAFAVLVQYVTSFRARTPAALAGFTHVLANVLSIAEVRALSQAVTTAFDADVSQVGHGVWLAVASVTPQQAFEMVCSSFVYVNIVRMLFPLSSWKQTDDDLKFLARGLLLSGDPAQARGYIEKINQYDVEAAQVDALVTASLGDLRTAAKKTRWAHARNALPEDNDLVFLDTIGPLIFIGGGDMDFTPSITFAIETKVSDVILAAIMLFGQASGRVNPRTALDIMKTSGRLDEYPLSAAALEIGNADPESGRRRLDACSTEDPVAKCAKILLREISASTSFAASAAPSIHRAAEEVGDVVKACQPEELSLAGQLALVSIVTTIRLAVASRGEASASLAALTANMLARIRELHPSHREYASLLEKVSRFGEAKARREARTPSG